MAIAEVFDLIVLPISVGQLHDKALDRGGRVVQAPGHAKVSAAALKGNALDFLRVVVVVLLLSVVVVVFFFIIPVVVVLFTMVAVMLLREWEAECTTVQPSLSAEKQLVAVPSEPAATIEVG